MATQPTNPIIRVAENDTILPSTGLTNKLEPIASIKTVGFDATTLVAAEELNYIFDNIADWVQYCTDRITELQDQIEQERVSIGEIIAITGDSTNPAILKGYGTWVAEAEGRALVGVGTYTDDRGELKNWLDGHVEGEYSHVQTEAEIAQHGHSVTGTTDNSGDHVHTGVPQSAVDTDKGESSSLFSIDTTGSTDPAGDHAHSVTGTAADTGSSSPMNNIQPSQAVYYWKRTS